jgi:hypothetical protein
MSDVYRTTGVTVCSTCARPLHVLECFQYGVPGKYCSPKCIDEMVARLDSTSDPPGEKT